MRVFLRVLQVIAVTAFVFSCSQAFCFYPHNNDGTQDATTFLSAYPQATGTKLDSCTTCHKGGMPTGQKKSVGSCQYCHAMSGQVDTYNDFQATLNPYGLAYLGASITLGRTVAALRSIETLDSDGDGYSNIDEILTIHYPGDPNDTPAMVAAPSRVFSLAEIEKMPQVSQFLLMNASKSTDTYCEYTGVTMKKLLSTAGVLSSATGVTVFAPDGFATSHPLQPVNTAGLYYLYGIYPQADFFYDAQADIAKNPSTGWCDYSAPSCKGRMNGSPIYNPKGLQVILAFKRDGELLVPGSLGPNNQLVGEGPFRVVPPQKMPGPPDQRATATDAADQNTWVWPYDTLGDHNAGFSAKTATMIRVDPLPKNTTDIDTSEAGWNYVDQNQVVVYGAIDPTPNVVENIDALLSYLKSLNGSSFTKPSYKALALTEFNNAKNLIANGKLSAALSTLQNKITPQFNGCGASYYLTDCTAQTQVNTSVYDMIILLQIVVTE